MAICRWWRWLRNGQRVRGMGHDRAVVLEQWSLSLLMPHSTAWRVLWSSRLKAGARPPPVGPRRLRLRIWSAGSRIVQAMPRRRSGAGFARELWAFGSCRPSGAVGLVAAHPPGAGARLLGSSLRTRIASSRFANWGELPRCLAVTSRVGGRRACSTTRWIVFVVNPPWDRPSARSAGSSPTPPPGGSRCRSSFLRPGRVLVRMAYGRVDVHGPGDQPTRASVHLKLLQDPGPGAVTRPPPNEAVRGLP